MKIRILSIILALCSVSLSATSVDDQTKQSYRIVALAPHIVELLYEIGAGDQIVGTVDFSDYPDDAKSIPRLGGSYGLQIEKILAAKPDLVIYWQSGNKQTDIEKMASLGLNLVASEPKQLSDIATEIKTFGHLTGRMQAASVVAQAYANELNQIIKQYEGARSISVFYQLWSKPLMTINKDTWIDQAINICGARNVFSDAKTAYPQISIEHVVKHDPDVLIVPIQKDSASQPTVDWSAWPNLKAVKLGALVTVNPDMLHRFSSRMLIGLREMCTQINNFRNTR